MLLLKRIFQVMAVSTIAWMHHLDANKRKVRWKRQKAPCCLEQILEPTPLQISTVWPLTSYLTNQDLKDLLGTAGEAEMNS